MPTTCQRTATYEILELNVVQWAKDRQIIPNAKPHTQLLKAISESGELIESYMGSPVDDDDLIEEDDDLIADAIGDISVCLINYAALRGLSTARCVSSTYHDVLGVTPDAAANIVPEGSTMAEYIGSIAKEGDSLLGSNRHPVESLLTLMVAMGNLSDAEAKCVPQFQLEFAIGAVFIHLIEASAALRRDFTHCLSLAYDEIKDRKGYLTPEGTFVKEE
jgi:hypothetical protein